MDPEFTILMPDSSGDSNAPFVKFMQDLHRYAERTTESDISDVKAHIASFTAIYNECENKDDLSVFISKLSGLITRLYSTLSESMYDNERHFIQEFYFHWKQILCHVKPKSRSKCCERSLAQMNTCLRHLRSALNRMEQIAILDVLFLYVENATFLQDIQSDQINDLREIARIEKNKSPKVIHNYLNYINVDGDNIFTIKPTNVLVVNFKFDSLEQSQEVWLDFNLKESTVAFVAYSTETEELLCSGIANDPEIQEYLVNGEYLLLSSGWTLSHTDGIQKPDVPKLVFSCLAKDKIKVNSFKSGFNISDYTDFNDVTGNAGL